MALMPDEQMGDAVQGDGQRQWHQGVDLGGMTGIEPGEGHYHVRMHAHAQGRLEGGYGRLDPAVEILLRQLVIQHPAIPPLAVGLHVGVGEVAGEIPAGLAQGRVIPLH